MAGSKKASRKKAGKKAIKRNKRPVKKTPRTPPPLPVAKEVTLSIRVKYEPDGISPSEIASFLDSAMRAGLVKDPPQIDGVGPILISNFFEPSDEDEMLIFGALVDAIDVAKGELGKLKKVLETNS